MPWLINAACSVACSIQYTLCIIQLLYSSVQCISQYRI